MNQDATEKRKWSPQILSSLNPRTSIRPLPFIIQAASPSSVAFDAGVSAPDSGRLYLPPGTLIFPALTLAPPPTGTPPLEAPCDLTSPRRFFCLFVRCFAVVEDGERDEEGIVGVAGTTTVEGGGVVAGEDERSPELDSAEESKSGVSASMSFSFSSPNSALLLISLAVPALEVRLGPTPTIEFLRERFASPCESSAPSSALSYARFGLLDPVAATRRRSFA